MDDRRRIRRHRRRRRSRPDPSPSTRRPTWVTASASRPDTPGAASWVRRSPLFAVCLPSLTLMIPWRVFYETQREPAGRRAMRGMRPVVIGMIAAAALLLIFPPRRQPRRPELHRRLELGALRRRFREFMAQPITGIEKRASHTPKRSTRLRRVSVSGRTAKGRSSHSGERTIRASRRSWPRSRFPPLRGAGRHGIGPGSRHSTSNPSELIGNTVPKECSDERPDSQIQQPLHRFRPLSGKR